MELHLHPSKANPVTSLLIEETLSREDWGGSRQGNGCGGVLPAFQQGCAAAALTCPFFPSESPRVRMQERAGMRGCAECN